MTCLQDHGLTHLLTYKSPDKSYNNRDFYNIKNKEEEADIKLDSNKNNNLNIDANILNKFNRKDRHNNVNIKNIILNKVEKDNTQSASANSLHPLMNKGNFKTEDNLYAASNSYSYKNFDYVKIGNKNQMLGSGAFADVFLAVHRIENRKYAIKVMNKEKLSKSNVKSSFIKKEINIHSRLDHPYIISLKCHHETSEFIYMVMDYAKNGTLFSKIKKMKNGFSEESAFKYFIQTCSAIFFLQKNCLAHRDLKPENILLDENNNIKLSDFGWCSFYNNKDMFTDVCGTYEYMAPEIIKEERYNEKVDNWALGILLYEILHGKAPFLVDNLYSDKNATKILFSLILKNKINFKNELSEDVKDLITSKYVIYNIYIFLIIYRALSTKV